MIDTSISLPNCPKNHDHTEVCTVFLDEVRERVMDAVPEKFWETNFSGDDPVEMANIYHKQGK